MSTKVVIIEDEAAAADHLQQLLTQAGFNYELLAVLPSVASALRWFDQNAMPDLVFSDVQLSDGLCFEWLDEVDVTCPVIFTTAYHEYAIRALKAAGIDYLLKPIDLSQVREALHRYAKHQAQVASVLDRHLNLSVAFRQQRSEAYQTRFLFASGTSFIPIETHLIAYFFRDQQVFVRLKDGRQFACSESLSQLQEKLDPNLFVRLNRTMLVRVDSIVRLNPDKPGKLELVLSPPFEQKIVLSQERSSWLRKWLNT